MYRRLRNHSHCSKVSLPISDVATWDESEALVDVLPCESARRGGIAGRAMSKSKPAGSERDLLFVCDVPPKFRCHLSPLTRGEKERKKEGEGQGDQ